jgi:flagellar motor protein MotB
MRVDHQPLAGQPIPMTSGPSPVSSPRQITQRAAAAAQALKQVGDQLQDAMSDLIKSDMVVVRRNEFWIEVGEKQAGPGLNEAEMRVDHQPLAGQPIPMTSGASPLSSPRQITQRAAAAAQALKQVGDQLQDAMSDLIKSDMVVVRRNEFWIEVEIKTDILFPSAGALLATNAVGIMERLAKVLAPFNNLIRVEGHTDNRPINTVAFYSNWELSAARAASVVRVLASHGVAPERLAVIGYGETRPRAPNTTAEGRDQNRRVVMVILSTDVKPDQSQQAPASGQSPQQAAPPAANAAAPSAAGESPANGTVSAP